MACGLEDLNLGGGQVAQVATVTRDVPTEMSAKTGLGLALIAAAGGLGAVGDGLLRATPWGLNVGLWTIAIVLAVIGVARWRDARLGPACWLFGPISFFGMATAWRASPTLLGCNLLALLLCLGLLASFARKGSLASAGVLDYALGLVVTGLHASFGALFLGFSDVRWGEVPREGTTRQLLAVGRGLVIAVPLLLVFGGLFVAADAVFEGLVRDYLAIDVATLVGHLALALMLAWIAAGWLRHLFIAEPTRLPTVERPSALTLGTIEIGIILGLLDVLFLAFVLVQFRYLFGGAPVVEASPTLTYAEYARRGFFELNAVAALLLPILLVVDWAARSATAREVRLFRVLAGVLVVLLFVVVASALQRMRLYTDELGLTELRLYTTAFMLWITLTFAWFLATVLRGRRGQFMIGALCAGLAILVGLNALNPDATIARANASRQGGAVPFDREYVLRLSADAVPATLASLPAMSRDDQAYAAGALLRQWSAPESRDWRTWNRAREEAWQAVEANRELLTSLAPPPGSAPDTRTHRDRGRS